MNRIILGSALVWLAAGPAAAQSPEPRAPAVTRGAEVRIERPDMSLFLRCGEGETAKSCAETATQLMEKLASMPPAERGRRGGDRDERRGGRDRDRDRE